MRIAEEVAQIITGRMKESGSLDAVRIETAEITRITGCLPAVLVEEIRKELAVESLVLVEMPTSGFAVADPRVFSEAPVMNLSRPRRPV